MLWLQHGFAVVGELKSNKYHFGLLIGLVCLTLSALGFELTKNHTPISSGDIL